jgi:hypothetical protein
VLGCIETSIVRVTGECSDNIKSKFKIDGVCFCTESYSAHNAIERYTGNFPWLGRFAWAAIPCDIAYVCTKATECIAPEIPMFITNETGISTYVCECDYGYYRDLEGKCTFCSYEQSCPAYSDYVYICPKNSHQTKPNSIGSAHDPRTAVYCIPETGYILEDRRENEYAYMFSSNIEPTSIFYAIPVNVEVVCQYDTRQVIIDGKCGCVDGYFMPASGIVCELCTMHSYCNDGVIQQCPSGTMTLYSGASDRSECKCKASYIRQNGTCNKIQVMGAYSVACTSLQDQSCKSIYLEMSYTNVNA